MKIIVIILSIIIFVKTVSYGIFEVKGNNKSGGIAVIAIAIVALIFPNVMIYIRGV